MRILILLVVAGALFAAEPGGGSAAWHSGWMLEAVGIVAALVIGLVLWFARKLLAAAIGIVVILATAGLVALALFGRDIGIYDIILKTDYADPAKRARLDEAIHRAGEAVETWDDDAPTFEEFERSNPPE
jgi:hypothetical protein